MTKLTEDMYYIGVNDHEIDLFEGQYTVPNGMSYNSYLVMDEKITVFDTVDAKFTDKWFANIEEVIGDKTPDYLVVHHMEPDHSANIDQFARKYPEAKIVANPKTFVMMKQFFGTDYPQRQLVVKEREILKTGSHAFLFIMAPLVHWPEVMVTYDEKDKILYSADGFGKFGALDVEEDWICEARRYYFGIVGKYGKPVQNLLAKASSLEIQSICPLHGPVLTENIEYYLNLYHTWSSYEVESQGTMIAYTSIYGNTKKAVEYLAEKLKEEGCPKVIVTDLARCDMAEAVEDAFRYGNVILATTTYNGDIFPFMREFLADLTERGYQNRKIGLIENGTWAAQAIRIMKKAFEKSKNITFAETTVSIKSAMNEQNKEELVALAKEMR